MKKIISLFLLCSCYLPLMAGDISDHSLSMNLGGPLAITSFEYEYKFIDIDKVSVHFTMGVGSLVFGYSMPIGFTYTYGNENQLLIGAHYTLTYFGKSNPDSFFSIDPENSLMHAFSPRIGVRKIFKVSREMAYFQAYLSPIFSPEITGVFAWGGLGFGVYL